MTVGLDTTFLVHRQGDSANPGEETVRQFLAWMDEHRLGRKRLLDTMLAATYATAGIRRIATSNARDYRVFGLFDLVEI